MKNIFNKLFNRRTKGNIWEHNSANFNDAEKRRKEDSLNSKKRNNIAEPQQKSFIEEKPIVVKEVKNSKSNSKEFKQKESKLDRRAKSIIVSVVVTIVAVIVLPLAILFGLSTIFIDSELIPTNLGYESDTIFSLENMKTGKFVKPPEYEGEKLKLVSDEESTYKFRFVDQSIYIEADNHFFNGEDLVINVNENEAFWSNADDNSGIKLVKKNENENLFAILFEKEKKIFRFWW